MEKLQAGPQFSMQWDGEAEAQQYGLASMQDANSDAPDVLEFVAEARIGEERTFGGGAAPLCNVRRVL